MRLLITFLLYCALVGISVQPLQAAHGVSIDGNLKYPPDFQRFDYTSEKAVKGGDLVLHDLGSFDKMNPFTLKGDSPFGLDFLVFETLSVSSLDEPFAQYGLIAQDIALSEDRLSVTFTLNPAARFSDGTPITAEDVKYSLETLKSDLAHPFYQIYLQDIVEAKILEPGRITFFFSRPNRELHMIASQLPVLNSKFFKEQGFGEAGSGSPMIPPVGSGPYVVEKVNPGKSITYRRNPEYWAKDLPVRRGQYNFDSVTVKYFKDQVVSLEAFKAGEFDFMAVNIAKQWQNDLEGKRFASGELIKKQFPHRNNAGMQGFTFNTRKALFQDRRVRQALGLAFDFEGTNTALFHGQYTRSNSYFSNSDLAATGLPEGKELQLLEPFRDKVPPEVFTRPLEPVSTNPPASLRGNLLLAKEMLTEAGWRIENGRLVNETGQPFAFEILLASNSFERVMALYVKNLEKLGIDAKYRTIDPALYSDRIKRHDYDMVVNVFGQSQSPGNEQRDYWHSSSLDREGSRNLAGVNDPVVDQLVDAVIYANTQEELRAACHALDRVLWYGYFVVPNWYLDNHRLAFISKLRSPDTLPLYYDPHSLLFTWWLDAVKQ